jgi:protein-L-isoaspartate(D-aspartate) O-methyltransferase
VAVSGAAWTLEAYLKAVSASGRSMPMDQATFDAVQARKAESLVAMRGYLKDKLLKPDERVIDAFASLPREYYHYNYLQKRSTAGQAYEKNAKPWALGYGSALSDYLGQAYMTQLCDPKPTDVALEIGTGSGFQASWLSRLVKEVYSIEIQKGVGEPVAKLFQPLGLSNVHRKVADGYFGWPEVQGGFDIILVTCAARILPPRLASQLKPGGRLILPVGQPFKRGQVLYIYTKDKAGKLHSRRDVGVFFVPMTGELQDRMNKRDKEKEQQKL